MAPFRLVRRFSWRLGPAVNRTGVEREGVGHLHIAASGLGDQHVAWQVIIVVRFASINEITTLAVIILDPSVIAAVLVGSQLNRIAHGHLKRSWRNENDVSHFFMLMIAATI